MATTKIITEVTDLNAASSTNGLKMPTGGAYSGTPTDGMMRNDTTGSSKGSASTMQHFNGTDWKNFENLPNSITVDYLVIAGGGSGGYGSGGGPGGGAGGLKTTTTYSGSETPLVASLGTAYTVEVGAGASSTAGTGVDGEDSKFGVVGSEIISTGGGGGNDSGNGRAGGSGGGAGNSNGAVSGVGGAASPAGQGNVGGNTAKIGTNNGNNAGGGGGGAGAVGSNASSGVGGNGGAGLEVNIIGGTGNYYAGGGGGVCRNDLTEGTGGIGGGGAGGWLYGNPGAINTGGGGGGGRSTSTSSSGGSGIVILRYPTADASSFAVTGTLDTTTDTAYPIANTAYYKLNDDADDATGIYNGTATASVSYPDGRFGKAASGFTASQYISIPTMGLFLAKNTSSVSMWIKSSGATSPLDYFFADYSGSSFNHGIFLAADGSIKRGTRYSSVDSAEISSSTGFADNNWHHVVSVVNVSNNTQQLYVDGSLADSGSIPTNSWSSLGNVEKVLIGGLWGNNQSNNLPFGGSIDQVRIFSSAISAGNVTSLYNEGTVVESTDGTDSILQFIGGTGTVTFS